jgi:hypothetical protein
VAVNPVERDDNEGEGVTSAWASEVAELANETLARYANTKKRGSIFMMGWFAKFVTQLDFQQPDCLNIST